MLSNISSQNQRVVSDAGMEPENGNDTINNIHNTINIFGVDIINKLRIPFIKFILIKTILYNNVIDNYR